MAARVPARLTPAEGRKFAFPVGLAFLALTGLFYWREVRTGVWIAGTLGVLLLLAGALIPARLGPVQRGWMALAHAISKVTTPIILGLLYFLVITPVGLLARLFGHRALVHSGASTWMERPAGSRKSDLQRQF